MDMAEKRMVSQREATELAERLGAIQYIETSAKSGVSVDKAFMALAKVVK
jgi:hypothetical protein